MATKGERSEPRAEDTTYRRPEACDPKGVRPRQLRERKSPSMRKASWAVFFQRHLYFLRYPFSKKRLDGTSGRA